MSVKVVISWKEWVGGVVRRLGESRVGYRS